MGLFLAENIAFTFNAHHLNIYKKELGFLAHWALRFKSLFGTFSVSQDDHAEKRVKVGYHGNKVIERSLNLKYCLEYDTV